MTTTTVNQSHLGEILAAERPRLLGLCTYLTGDPDSAEDIVQEVMLEAWRSFGKLRDPDAMDAWRNGIVRKGCINRKDAKHAEELLWYALRSLRLCGSFCLFRHRN
jgi:DNA-directed RNA polymerase specialized sigma24 family protein